MRKCRDVGQRFGQLRMIEAGETEHRQGGEGRPDQRVASSLACEQHEQNERVIFEQAGAQVDRIGAEPPGPRCPAEGAAADDQQEDDEIAVGAFKRVERHRRQCRQGKDQHFAAGGGADHDGQRQDDRQVEAEADGVGRRGVEKVRDNREPQRRVGVHAAERVARVREVNVDPQPPALRRGEHRMDVEKRKAERLETEQRQDIEIKRVRAPPPQPRKHGKQQQRQGWDCQTTSPSRDRVRRGKCGLGRAMSPARA